MSEDYKSFKHGLTRFPLPTGGTGNGGIGATLLQDADPPLATLIDFYSSVIKRHIGPRLMQEAVSIGANISTAVAEWLPLNPEPWLHEAHIRFPLLAAYRKSSKTQDVGQGKHSRDEIDVCYILKPLQAGEAERLLPILKAVASVIDNRTQLGMDPLFTPLGGEAGDHVWEAAGVAEAEFKGASYGSYAGLDDRYYPCVICHIELLEKSDYYYEELEDLNRANVDIDIVDPVQETVVEDVVQFYGGREIPTITSLSPSAGTKQGGTSVTITGTNFVVGTTPTVYFGGVAATSVVVASTTSITCVTPAHDAYDTFEADVDLIDFDAQEATLEGAFTFTSP